jgi:class 3 adenylate cyclase
MSLIRRANLDDPHGQRSISRGNGSMARIGPLAIGRATLEPGWRWSEDLRPMVGTEWCQAHHLHVLLAGRFAVRMADADAHEEFEPGDVFDVPPGHEAWVVGGEPVVILDVSGNVAEFGLPVTSPRRVVTMLMSDIVDSTPTAARLGDAAWRQVLADHNRLIRSLLSRYNGQEVDTTGDGFFVTFDSAAAAVACAREIRDAVRTLGLEVRIGIHTGEIEVVGDGVRGIAVHALARVMAAAGRSEVLVSPVARALTQGTDLRLVDRGPHQLKGIDEPMTLYAVQ